MEKIIYADHSATTYVKPEVLEEMLPFFSTNFGNPSSMYSLGRTSKEAVEKSRKQVAKAIGAKCKDEIYFTSGGSEADNMIIKGIARANRNKGNHIITTKIEHPAVLNTCKSLEKEGFEITYLGVNSKGFININDLKNAIKDETILISIMFANSEIGTIQNIKEIGKLARFKEIYFHTDAVQAIGNVNIDVNDMCIDALSLSAHKFYGPKGIGAAYINKKVKFDNLICGGHQERSKRAGTENVPAIVGLGKAIEIASQNVEKYNEKLLGLRNHFIENLKEKIDGIVINGDLEKRLPGNVNVTLPNIDSETMLIMLDMNGICASAGSACTTTSVNPSHVLTAIGLNEKIAKCSLRLTFGEENTIEDVDFIIENIVNICKKLENK